MNKDFFKSSNPSRFHSLRDTRPEPTTWQVLFKEITNSTHTAATRHYRAHLATLSDIEATGDAQQLERFGEGLYRNKGGNGEIRLLPSNTDGIGTLVSKQVEASNVNLSDEFGDLILIQRGFQAASQVVSISNDMIQQLFGIKGQ